MTVAGINTIVLALTEEKSNLELERTFIDSRREMLALKTSALCTEYQTKLAKSINMQDVDEEDTVEVFNDEEFQLEYTIAQEKLDCQDKMLERERSALETKLNSVTAQLEGAEKQLQNNIEKEFKNTTGN